MGGSPRRWRFQFGRARWAVSESCRMLYCTTQMIASKLNTVGSSSRNEFPGSAHRESVTRSNEHLWVFCAVLKPIKPTPFWKGTLFTPASPSSNLVRERTHRPSFSSSFAWGEAEGREGGNLWGMQATFLPPSPFPFPLLLLHAHVWKPLSTT